MDKMYKWGIIGPGRIARKFAQALALVPNAKLHAVASRDREKAKAFATEFNAPVIFDSYEKLANLDELDAVYIATPHTYHHAHALLCLRKKIAVLCEKPMSVDYASTLDMVNVARENNCFLMEAMWSRFLPIINKAVELVKQGEIGELKYLKADFGFVAPFDNNSRLYNLALGGGAQLDIGVYPMFFALLLMGKPDEIKSYSQLASTGADETTSALFYYKNGMMANILSSITTDLQLTAEISGTAGTIMLDRPWYKGNQIQVRKKDAIEKTFSLPYGDNGFEFQIEEVQKCLAAKQTESALLPLDFSLLMSEVADDILRMGNIKYPVQSS